MTNPADPNPVYQLVFSADAEVTRASDKAEEKDPESE